MMASLPRVLSLCSGIGVFDAVLCSLNMQIVGQVEYNRLCRTLLTEQFPDVVRVASLLDVQGDEFGPIDVVAAGLLYAGDARRKDVDRCLWPHVYRVLARARPSVVLLEHIPGLLTLHSVLADLNALGYRAQLFVFPACATSRHTRSVVIATSLALSSGLPLRHEEHGAWEWPYTMSPMLMRHTAHLSTLGQAVGWWDQAYAACWVVAQLLSSSHEKGEWR